MPVRFRLNPALDDAFVSAAASAFQKTRRLHIPEFLHPEDADHLHAWLASSESWKMVINQGDKIFELDRAAQKLLTEKQRLDLEDTVYKAAQRSFQFKYETIRIPDGVTGRTSLDSPVADFAQFLSSQPIIDMFSRITSCGDLGFADAQATAYRNGDFLTAHHDEADGKQRRAAYVFNLTPAWQIDWGGLLMFHSPDGHVDEAFAPRFNALNIFAVPLVHSVSMVTPIAPKKRYSITGWLRAEEQPR